MGQDLKNSIKIDNPFSVYRNYFLNRFDLDCIETSNSLDFEKGENLCALCKRFSDNTFKNALTQDNLYRIKNLNFKEYIYFLYSTIVLSDNFYNSVNQIFNSTGYEFQHYIENMLQANQIDVIEKDFNFSLNEEGDIIFTPEVGGIWQPVVDHELLWLQPIANFQFGKPEAIWIISCLLQVENKIVQLIKKDCDEFNIDIEHSIKNHKWLIIYALSSIRENLELELTILKVGFKKNHFVSNKLDEIVNLFECYFEEVTDSNPKNYGRNLVEYLGGKNEQRDNWKDYFEIVLDKNLNKFKLKDRRIGISKLFYFLYTKKWFLTHYNKPKNTKRKGSEFSETLQKLLVGVKGFSESNIRENHLLDLSPNENIELISYSDNTFSETNKLIERYT